MGDKIMYKVLLDFFKDKLDHSTSSFQDCYKQLTKKEDFHNLSDEEKLRLVEELSEYAGKKEGY
jgi:hypothetical protein